jgi:hypothetical protein
MISTGTLRRVWTAWFLLVCSAVLLRAQAPAPDATVLRVFLKDGSTLLSYGEFSRVGDHVVISLPLQLNPLKLQVVSIPESRVDWAKTDAYSDSARAARYGATRGPQEYAQLVALVNRQLSDINVTEDPSRKVALALAARQNLTKWEAEHFGYHAGEVAQMTGWFDDIIAKTRVASGQPNFDLSLVAANAMPPSVPLLPAPDSAAVIRQSFEAAKNVDSASDRISLLRAIRDALETNTTDPSLAQLKAAVERTVEEEEKTTSVYATYIRQVLHAAARLASKADVQGLIDMAAHILEDDDKMGHKRPDEVASLLAAVDAKLEAARELRLTRDQWEAQRQDRYAYYHAIEIPERALRLSRPALAAIQQLAGPAPDVLGRAKTRLSMAGRILNFVKAPRQMEPVNALLVGAMQLANRAVESRFAAVQNGNMQQAKDASAAAAGALLLFDRATLEIQKSEAPPQLK